MTKQARHFAIKNILTTMDVRSQDHLRRELQKRGFRVTQATLSRDLKELGVSRGSNGHVVRYTLQPGAEVEILRPVVAAEVISIVANESVVVVRTLPGCANTIGEFIDVQNHPGIIGTLAGDNTLLVIPEARTKVPQIVKYLKDKLIEGT
jgi:transcriptional regulator of arginine metabolism